MDVIVIHHAKTRLAAGLAAAALALTACSGGAPANDDPDAPTTIRLVLFGGPEEQAAYQRVADAFHGEHPDLTVELQVVAKQDDLLARLTSAFAAGTPPDLFLINFRKYGLYAEQGVLAPVQQFLDASDAFDLDEFYQAPLDAFRFGGTELTCMPQNVSSLVTYVNLDLFEAAGVDLPTSNWDWDDFTAAAQATTGLDPDGNGTASFGIGTSPSLIRLAPLVWSNGGEVVDDSTSPTRLTLDTPEAIEALDFLTSLPTTGIAPGDLDEQARDSESRFLDGDLAMYWSSRREVPTFREVTSFDWDVAPFPIAPGGQPVTMLHSDAFCLSAQGKTTDAWQFVEFALGEVGATILAESGRTVPSNRPVAESDAFLRTDVPPAHARVFLDNAEIVRATPSTADWNAVENQADDILEALYFGRITREVAVERLAALRLGNP